MAASSCSPSTLLLILVAAAAAAPATPCSGYRWASNFEWPISSCAVALAPNAVVVVVNAVSIGEGVRSLWVSVPAALVELQPADQLGWAAPPGTVV